MKTAFSSLLLFPSFEHHRIHVGMYNRQVDAPEVRVDEIPVWPVSGIEIGWRHFTEGEFSLGDDEYSPLSGSETPTHARLYMTPEGTIQIDQLSLGTALFGATVRPELGDMLDLSFLGGKWISTVAALDTGRFQLRGLVPSELTLLGFSNTDFDEDKKLKYYISVGSGVGGELIGRIIGPLGVYGRAIGHARTFNRHQGGGENQVRHELHAEVEAGLAVLSQRQAFWLSGWGELTSQHETRDADRKSGADRQYMALGIRLNARFEGGDTPADPDDSSDKSTRGAPQL